MVNILNIKDDIVKVSLGVNVISLLTCFFYFSKLLFIIVISINIVLNYTLIIMSKWGDNFITQYKKMWNKNG